MPLAIVSYREVVLDHGGIREVVEALPQLVANALSVKAGPLVPGDIEVRTWRVADMDIVHHDVGIVVFANRYPEREAKLEKSTEKIKASVEDLLAGTGLTSYVWILLGLGSFREFQAAEPVEHFSGWKYP